MTLVVRPSAPLQIAFTLTTTGPPTVVCVFQAETGAVNGNAGPGATPWTFTNQPFKPLRAPHEIFEVEGAPRTISQWLT